MADSKSDSKKAQGDPRLVVPYAQVELKNGLRVHLQRGDVVTDEVSDESKKTLEELNFLSTDPFLADNT